MWKFLHKLASPPHFYRIAKIMIPWLAVPGYLLIVYGVFVGLFVAPAYPVDQGVTARIIYVHVASAYLSMMGYMIMAVAGASGYIWRMKLAHAVAASAAPLGASFTFLALVTGSIWGRPTWGTYWEWSDPRLVSELILLFLYFGYMALRSAIDDIAKADKASAILTCHAELDFKTHSKRTFWTLPEFPAIRVHSQPVEFQRVAKSGRQDLNLRPLDPQSSALPGCATSRELICDYELRIFSRQITPLSAHVFSPDIPSFHLLLQVVSDFSLNVMGTSLVCRW